MRTCSCQASFVGVPRLPLAVERHCVAGSWQQQGNARQGRCASGRKPSGSSSIEVPALSWVTSLTPSYVLAAEGGTLSSS